MKITVAYTLHNDASAVVFRNKTACSLKSVMSFLYRGTNLFIKRKLLNLLTAFATGAMLLLLARICVTFFESLEIVRSDRNSDESLLDLCNLGTAAESSRMRNACMDARAAHASPILIKALSRMGQLFSNDMYAMFCAPMRYVSSAGYASIVGILGILPWIGGLRTLIGSGPRVQPEELSGRHSVVIMHNGEPHDSFGGQFPHTHGLQTKRLTARKSIPYLEEGYSSESTGR